MKRVSDMKYKDLKLLEHRPKAHIFDTIGNNFLLFMPIMVCNRILFGNDLLPKLVMVIVIYYKFRAISYSL